MTNFIENSDAAIAHGKEYCETCESFYRIGIFKGDLIGVCDSIPSAHFGHVIWRLHPVCEFALERTYPK